VNRIAVSTEKSSPERCTKFLDSVAHCSANLPILSFEVVSKRLHYIFFGNVTGSNHLTGIYHLAYDRAIADKRIDEFIPCLDANPCITCRASSLI
jgi:hypothetical protein